MPNLRVSAILFDLDGTLLDSTAVVVRLWTGWARSHGIEPEALLPVSHGRPAIETMRHFRPDSAALREEAKAHIRAEEEDTAGIVPIPGALPLLSSLAPDRWAIVTSCPPQLALVRRTAAGLPEPRVLITPEDVVRGKPAPDCYLLGAERLGFTPEQCLVVEDSIAGIQAGLAAGAQVLALTTTHAAAQLPPTHALAGDLSGIRVSSVETGELLVQVPE